jgi:putative tricarboxylic transport membrane protein
VVNALMATHLVSHLAMYAVMVSSCLLIARLMYVHRSYILPVVLVFCVVGSFAVNNRMFDVWTMIAFGAIGFFLEYAKVPLGPFVIGLVLAPLAEGQLRAGLMSSDGSLWPLVERPIALTFLIISAVMFIWPFWREWRRRAM